MVLFINGPPLAVIELKNAADENATMPELQVVLEGVFDKGRTRLTGGKHWSATSISGIARRTLVQGLGRVLLAPPRHHPYLHEADA